VSQPQEQPHISNLQVTKIDAVQILDNLPDGVTIQDTEFTVIYQNKSMLAAFGKKIGMKCYTAYEKRDAVCEGCGVAKAFQTGRSVLVLRTAFDAKGGTSYWENSCFSIRGENGAIIAGAEICRNVTDRVSLEEEVKQRNIELGQLNKQLQRQTAQLSETFQHLEQEVRQRERVEIELRQSQKLQAVGQLAAGIAHEINTPAQFVGDNLHFLAESFKDLQQLLAEYRRMIEPFVSSFGHDAIVHQLKEAEDTADMAYLEAQTPLAIQEAEDGISRISTIVRAMKEFAHPDQHDQSPEDLNQALQSTLIIAHNEYKSIADVHTELGMLPPVTCYLGEINQVFLNLLVNAAHAIADVIGQSGGKGTIFVRTSHVGDHVQIEITDTGSGIPQNIQQRVFEPFFTTKAVGRGSGQGLAIARAIVVDKHGGSLTFQSKTGLGTTFTIQLPVNGKAGHPEQ
jgi:signal transduction histidine kinase